MQLYLLMMGLDGPETCRGLRNILRISCASSWFFFTLLYRDARSTEHYYYYYYYYYYFPVCLQIWAVFIPCCCVVALCPISVVHSFVSTLLLFNIGFKCVIKVLLRKKVGLCSFFIRAERRSHETHNIQIKATLREG